MLGAKPDLAAGASDDIKADASNRKRAKLYKVRGREDLKQSVVLVHLCYIRLIYVQVSVE